MEWWLIAPTLMLVMAFLVALRLLLYRVYYSFWTRKCTSQARLDGKTVIVTGATSGIGKEAALMLADRGCRLIMACLDERIGQHVADEIISKTGNSNVVVRVLDVADLDSVRRFAAKINAEEEALHVLVNNAGIVMDGNKQCSKQGFELTLATNYYGWFLLTNLLLGKLKSSAPSRIVNVAADGYMSGTIELDDLNFEKRQFSGFQAYCRSKLCCILFTKELARRLQDTGVTANCLHPGAVSTNIFDRANAWWTKLTYCVIELVGRTAVQGAQTIVYLAVSEEVDGVSGKFFENCQARWLLGKARDMEVAGKLWNLTTKDVNLTSEEIVIP